MMIFLVASACRSLLPLIVNILKTVGLTNKLGNSRSEASWVKVSITQPDFTSPFAAAGRQVFY